jgi:hypothetical protein
MHYFTRVATSALVGVAWPLSGPREITVKELIPLVSWQKQFKITEGTDRGKVVLISQPDLADEKRWRLVFGDYAGILLVKNPSGALMMERLDLYKSRSYIVYEPALPVLQGDVSSSGSIRLQTRYKMYSRETGKLKRAGGVTHFVKQISHSQFDTPAGLIDGYYIEIDHRMDMEYNSQLHLSLGLGCRLDDGPVYGSGRYTLKKLGAVHGDQDRGCRACEEVVSNFFRPLQVVNPGASFLSFCTSMGQTT